MMDIQCVIVEMLPEQRGNGSRGEWVKHQFLAETVGQYQKKLKFDVWGDERWEKMKAYIIPTAEVKVSFDIESNEWNDRWYTQLNAFSVYAGSQAQQQRAQENTGTQTAKTDPVPPFPPAGSGNTGGNDDDLPF